MAVMTITMARLASLGDGVGRTKNRQFLADAAFGTVPLMLRKTVPIVL